MNNPNVPENNAADLSGYGMKTGGDPPRTAKGRRNRTTFNRAQLEAMENIFGRTHFPGYAERMRLAQDYDMDEARIQVWFKNRRSKFRTQEKMDPTQEWKCEEAAQAAAMLAQGHSFVTNSAGKIFKLADGPLPDLSPLVSPRNPGLVSASQTPYAEPPVSTLYTAGPPVSAMSFYGGQPSSFNYIQLRAQHFQEPQFQEPQLLQQTSKEEMRDVAQKPVLYKSYDLNQL